MFNGFQYTMHSPNILYIISSDGTDAVCMRCAYRIDAVMRELTARFSLDELRVFEPSLNDIFVEYAGDTTEEETA